MGQDAECYQKTVDDRAIILNPRAYYAHPFLAPDWTDLRVGFFLSLTDKTNDDLTTGFAETIPNLVNAAIWRSFTSLAGQMQAVGG